MATFLYRLGRAAFLRRRLVLTAWLALLVVLGAGAATLSGPTANTFSIPGTESQRALDLLHQRFPALGADKASAQVVITAPEGSAVMSSKSRAAVEKVVTELRHAAQVASVADPYTSGAVSKDGGTALVSVTYTVAQPGVTDAARADLTKAAAPARAAGLGTEFAGTATVAPAAEGATEGLGLVIAALILIVTFGSFVAAGLPLLNAIIGVGASVLGIEVATGFFQLSSSTSTLALMLGLAVSIDYSLFIVSRYRHELGAGHPRPEAAGRAVATAGSAVVFAGLTVIVALAGLSVVGIPFLSAMGIAAAGAVLAAVAIALTLLPAMLGFAGRRVLGRADRARSGIRPRRAGAARPGIGARWATFVVGHRGPVLVVAVLALLVIALPTTSLHLSMADNPDPSTTQARAAAQIDAAFGQGYNGPLLVVVDGASGDTLAAAAAATRTALSHLPDVAAVSPATPNTAGDTAILTVLPGTGPGTQATKALVQDIRERAGALGAANGAHLQVTGETAVSIDVSDKLSGALLPYLSLIVGFALVLLLLVFRSVLVPIKAVVGFLLSLGASVGAVVAVFQWGWFSGLLGVHTTGPILSILPIFLIGLLFGLAMDYEFFLVTRMREEHVHGAPPRAAIVSGFEHGARVVTAAALIMISVFGGFILSDQSIIKSIGLALAFGVLVDAFVVRMTIVPAVMELLGASAWWLPRWLDRALPRVDIEGDGLRADPGSGTSDDLAHRPHQPLAGTPASERPRSPAMEG